MDIDVKHKDSAEKDEHEEKKPYKKLGCYA